MSNKFIVSVANAIGRDPITKQGIFYGKANLSSAFTLSMSESEVRGGINNSLLFTYKHTRDLAIEIEQAIASKTFLALNTGTSLNSGVTSKVLATECVTFSGTGTATLANTPTSTRTQITIFLDDGRIAVPEVLAGSVITYADGANKKLDVVYEYMTSIDLLSIEATEPPSIIDLTLIAEVRDSQKGLIEYQHINIPSFQIDGNYELSFSADGVSSEKLSGKALRVDGETCEDGDTYGYVKWVPVSGTTTTSAILEIVTTPSAPVLVTAGTTQLVTKALYGGIIAPQRLLTGLTYTVTPSGKFTVNASGLLTAGAVTGADTATIEVTYTNGSTWKDYVFVKGQ